MTIHSKAVARYILHCGVVSFPVLSSLKLGSLDLALSGVKMLKKDLYELYYQLRTCYNINRSHQLIKHS